ncbi:hypothetical protein, partial [Treponema zioleckii]|uniref:hypothetical protein n=1 Tax=Treponema zioleckii TaxID=331680 RepID=UPI001A920F9E
GGPPRKSLRGGPFFSPPNAYPSSSFPPKKSRPADVENFSGILSTKGRFFHIFVWKTPNSGNTFDFFVETRGANKIGLPRKRKIALVTPLIFFGNTFDSFF